MLKKIVLLAFLCLPLGIKAQQVKIGHVNSQDILSAMPETSTAETALANFGQEHQTNFQRLLDEYQKKSAEFEQEASSLPEVIRNTREEEIRNLENRLKTYAEQARQDIAKKQNELYAPIIQKINVAIKAVGEKQGFTFIMESGNFLYAAPTVIDVAPLIKAELGLK